MVRLGRRRHRADARHRRDRADRLQPLLDTHASTRRHARRPRCASADMRVTGGRSAMKITLGRRTLMLGTAMTLVVGGIALAVLGAGGIVAWEYSNSNAFCTEQLPLGPPRGAARLRRVVARARPVRRVPHGPAADAAADDAQGDALPRAAGHDHRLRAAAHGDHAAPGARHLRGLPLAGGQPRRQGPHQGPLRRRRRRTPRRAPGSSCTPAAARRARRRRAASTGTSTRTSST